MIKKTRWTPDQALTELKRWCAVQERSHEEVKTKLIEKGVYGETIDQIIAELIAENFLNELRFAKAYVSGKFKMNGWGRNKIMAGLKQHKISAFNIRKSMETIGEDEYRELMTDTMMKKRRLLSVRGLTLKQKLFSYMVQKGFESSEIHALLSDFKEE